MVGQASSGGFFDRFAFVSRTQVNDDEVAVFHCTLNGLEGAKALAQTFYLSFDVGLACFHIINRDRNALVLRQGDFGAHFDFSGESQWLAIDKLGNIDFRLTQDAKFVIAHSVRVRI